MMIETLRTFIGLPPAGYEWLEYFAVLVVFLLLYRFVADIFRLMANFFRFKH